MIREKSQLLFDPIELMESRIERLCDEYIEGVCMSCNKKVGTNDLYCMSPMGDGPMFCAKCAGIKNDFD